MTLKTAQLMPRRVAFLLDNLSGGGAERVFLSIASGFADLGYTVDLLVCELRGELCDSIPHGVNLVVLQPGDRLAGLFTAARAVGWSGAGALMSWLVRARKVPRSVCHINSIKEYLQTQQPVVICSALGKSNINAFLAAASAEVQTRVFLGVHIEMSILSEQSRVSGKGQTHSMMPMFRYCFARAHGVIAVSRGVADNAIKFLGLNSDHVHVAYNPITAAADTDGKPQHPWFQPGAPRVILGMGRLTEQKNFPLLIRAFAAVRKHADVRLVILGGDESSDDQMSHRRELQALAEELGIADDVALLGWCSDPHVYLRAARLFVLSSNYEGFGNVVVEALLAACPVVSTDCPSGPAEILDSGRYGILVPVNNVDKLAEAIRISLATDPDPEKLRQRGREFSLDRAVDKYHQLFFGESSGLVTNES